MLIFDVYYGTGEVLGSFPTTVYEWLGIVGISLLTYIGPASLTIGLQIEMAGLLSLMRKAFAIIFSYTFQITLFGVSQLNHLAIAKFIEICSTLIFYSLEKFCQLISIFRKPQIP